MTREELFYRGVEYCMELVERAVQKHGLSYEEALACAKIALENSRQLSLTAPKSSVLLPSDDLTGGKENGYFTCAKHPEENMQWDKEIQKGYCVKCRAIREAQIASWNR